jgi:hypothetical protein
MIAAHIDSTPLFNACFYIKNLYFLTLNSRPDKGLFSAGELNVI